MPTRQVTQRSAALQVGLALSSAVDSTPVPLAREK